MSHALHQIGYKELFNGQYLSKPLSVKYPQNTRIIVISDCHLDSRFDKGVFEKFKKIIKIADVIVLNGDFWADSFVSFNSFMNSEWKQLFPLLKAKKTYYVFGNHDMPLLSDSRINEFCTWAGFRLKIKAGALSLHIEHGHLLSGNFVRAILTLYQKHPKLLKYSTYPFGIGEEITRYFAKKTNSKVLEKLNSEFKNRRHSVSKKDEYFLMGHTHVPEFDEKARYVNSGLTHNGHFDYIEVYNNKITLLTL